MESKQRRSRKHSSFDDGSERAREAEREEGRRRRARKERSGQRLSPSTAIADGEREGGRKTLESSFCGRQLSPAVRPSVRQSMRAVKRASASVKGIGHVLRSPPKPKGARRRESGQRRARHTATALAGHTGRGRTTHETEQQHVPRPGASAVHFTRAPGAGSETVDDGGKV